MQFRNFKMVDYVVYGRGAFNQLDEILAPRRKDNFPMIFFLDHYFIGKPLVPTFSSNFRHINFILYFTLI